LYLQQEQFTSLIFQRRRTNCGGWVDDGDFGG
jgi:hypothetical protein